MNHRYCILGGVGRSGTTALRNSIGRHPQIYYNGMENNTVQDIVSCAYRNRHGGFRGPTLAVSQQRYERLFERLIVDLIWPARVKRLMKPFWLCAINPEPEYAHYIFDLLPDAKLLYLVRNGIDVVASRQQYESFKKGTFKSHCEVWNRSVRMAEWVHENPDRAMIFRYEWFMNPEQLSRELGNVFAFFGLREHPFVEQSILAKRYHPTSGGKSNTDWAKASPDERQALLQLCHDKWSSWTESERRIFEEECKDGMDALGYVMPENV